MKDYFSDVAEKKVLGTDWKCLPQNRHATAIQLRLLTKLCLRLSYDDPEMDQFLSTVVSDTNINSVKCS